MSRFTGSNVVCLCIVLLPTEVDLGSLKEKANKSYFNGMNAYLLFCMINL